VWWSAIVVAIGGAMVVFGPWRVHDVFGDGTQLVKEWQLTEAVTRSGVKRLEPPQDLPIAAPQPEHGTTPDIEQDTTPPVVQDKTPPVVEDAAPDVLNGDDFCAT